MSSPIGHTLVGIAVARRLGVRSPAGLAAAAAAANLPDTDFVAGLATHGDIWKWHRKGTHTLGFAFAAGALAGATGAISAGHAEGERDLIADAMTGAAVVASHIALDSVKFPHRPMKSGMAWAPLFRNLAFNSLVDLVIGGALAYLLWPREAVASPSA